MFLRPSDFPGKSTGVRCHCLLPGRTLHQIKYLQGRWLARDNPEIDLITMKPETVISHMGEQSSWVPLPCCSLPGALLSNKAFCFISTCIYLDNSLLSVRQEPTLKSWRNQDELYWISIKKPDFLCPFKSKTVYNLCLFERLFSGDIPYYFSFYLHKVSLMHHSISPMRMCVCGCLIQFFANST